MYTTSVIAETLLGMPAMEYEIWLDAYKKTYRPNYELRNFKYNGDFEPEKYNMSFKELEYCFDGLTTEINENNDILATDVIDIIKENIFLVRKIAYLMKKYEFLKQYRFKGE